MEKHKLLQQRIAKSDTPEQSYWRKLVSMKLLVMQKKAVIRKMLLMNLFTRQIILLPKHNYRW